MIIGLFVAQCLTLRDLLHRPFSHLLPSCPRLKNAKFITCPSKYFIPDLPTGGGWNFPLTDARASISLSRATRTVLASATADPQLR